MAVGSGPVDSCRLEFDASKWLATDERGLSTCHAPVAGSDYNFRDGRVIGPQNIDDTFTDVVRDEAGRATVRFSARDGAGVALWADEAYPCIGIYPAYTQPAPHWRTGWVWSR